MDMPTPLLQMPSPPTQGADGLIARRRQRPSRVLAVDDDALILSLLRTVLFSAGYEVLLANDGADAIEQARARHPDLILLDVRMPGLDGHEIFRRLKADEATRDIPVIFVTALDDHREISQGFELGAVDYITKPLHVPVVLARVKTHLALHHQRRSLEGMFRDVIEFAPDAFVLVDAAGAIVRINARAEELFGYDREELLGGNFQQLLAQTSASDTPDWRAVRARPDRQVMRNGVVCRRQDGTQFPADINIGPLHTTHGVLFMALVRDASDRLSQEAQLRGIAAHAEAVREEERKHIAREVHDELGQILTALRMDVSLLAMRFGGADPLLAAKIGDMKSLIDRGIQGVRNVAANLRPAALDMGLVPALDWLCQETTARTGLACVLQAPAPQPALGPEREVVLFRMAQESITNAVRYSQARTVDVQLGLRGPEVVLRVRDDGVGFDPQAVAGRKSYGLLGMRERAHALGGRIEVRSAPGAGTTIRVSIPFEPAKGEDT